MLAQSQAPQAHPAPRPGPAHKGAPFKASGKEAALGTGPPPPKRFWSHTRQTAFSPAGAPLPRWQRKLRGRCDWSRVTQPYMADPLLLADREAPR